MLKHTGELPIVGVNTFQNPDSSSDQVADSLKLTRANADEKNAQITRLRVFQATHSGERDAALRKLEEVALAGGNIFECLMDVARVCSLGEITHKLFEVGGEYRRNM
jgi:methylmalonyl-CoA mutase